eukprot:UN16643
MVASNRYVGDPGCVYAMGFAGRLTIATPNVSQKGFLPQGFALNGPRMSGASAQAICTAVKYIVFDSGSRLRRNPGRWLTGNRSSVDGSQSIPYIADSLP